MGTTVITSSEDDLRKSWKLGPLASFSWSFSGRVALVLDETDWKKGEKKG